MTVKKAELHLHLEGAIFPALAQTIAQRNRVHLPSDLISPDGQSYLYKDFLDFLSSYDKVAAVIKKPQDYYDITWTYLKQSAEQGGIYAELMYSPDHAELSSGIPSIEHLQAIQEAIDAVEEQFQITARLIVTAVRHFGADSAVKVAKQALKDKAHIPCITGFGLGGDEAGFPPHLFEKAYQIAADGGLFCTIHAGEFDTAKRMEEAMNLLPISRIGHGVRAIGSPSTIELIKEKNILLELCPSSNLCFGLFDSLPTHPLAAFIEAGIPVGLSTDDPPFFRTTIGHEYDKVQSFLNYSDLQMLKFTQTAIDHAFVDEKTKTRLRARLK